jgi:hypothetical protein
MTGFDKWAGLVTNASPYSLPPGAMVEQVNLQCIAPGQVTVRPGMARITFVSTDSTTYPVRSVFRYQKGVGEHLVYQDSLGRIYSSARTAGV